MKTWRQVEVAINVFVTSLLEGCENSASRSDRLALRASSDVMTFTEHTELSRPVTECSSVCFEI